jgi:hypothetical protein
MPNACLDPASLAGLEKKRVERRQFPERLMSFWKEKDGD